MLKVGDRLPAGNLQEFIEVEGDGCSLGPNTFDIEKLTAGKTVAIFALPGPSRRPAPRSTCRDTSPRLTRSRPLVWTRSGACP